jgi:osmoprotectant transport system ATP-binding protein
MQLVGRVAALRRPSLFRWIGRLFGCLAGHTKCDNLVLCSENTRNQVLDERAHPYTGGAQTREMSAAIEFREVSFATPQGRLLLNSISLALEEGTTTAILGRSGSGKTTLLRTVNRMIEPTGGHVFLRGNNVVANLIALRRSIGYVIQETGLFPHFTIERNVGLVLEAAGRPRTERVRRSHELLTAVGLDPAGFAQRYPHQLSGGQRQRVGLARALAAQPEILLMDEPFGALDPLTRSEMQDMLRDLLTRLRKTVLMVTHDLDEALYLGDRIVLLNEGKLIANLRPNEFMASNQPEIEDYVRAFHHGERNAKQERLR